MLGLLGRLAFFFVLGAVALGGALAIAALARRRFERASALARTLALLAVVYLAALLAASLLSREVTLPLGAEKSFCDLDCDLHLSVIGAGRRVDPDASSPHPCLWWIKVRSRSDAKRVVMRLDHLQAFAIDERGNRTLAFDPASEALHPRPFFSPLMPGESDTTALAFDLPAAVRRPRLLITIADAPSLWVPGDESSLLHRKTLFALN